MASLTIRNLPDHIHKQLKQLAVQHDRSTEAEARNILSLAVGREFDGGLGTMIRNTWGENVGGDFSPVRSTDQPREVKFE